MKNKSIFPKVVLLFLLAVVCVALTVGVALFAGSLGGEMISLKDLNLSNVIITFVIGMFISFAIIITAMLFLARNIFYNLKEYYLKIKGESKK